MRGAFLLGLVAGALFAGAVLLAVAGIAAWRGVDLWVIETKPLGGEE